MFRATHGVGAGEAGRTGARLPSQPRMSLRLIVEGSSSMRYRVVEKEEFLRARLSQDAARADAEPWIPVERTGV